METTFQTKDSRVGNPHGYSEQFLKKRNLLLVLPLLLLPFITLAYWCLTAKTGAAQSANTVQGINTSLPGAQLKGVKAEDKLSLYEDQKRDSAAMKTGTSVGAFKALGLNTAGGTTADNTASDNENRITQKLAQITKEINRPEPAVTNNQNPDPPQNSAETERLEKLMKSMNTKTGDDPEMKQLNGMLEKIEDIQHPERVADQLKAQEKKMPDSLYKAFRAVVVDNAKVRTGASVELRLMETITIRGQVIPKGKSVFGLCDIANQRVLLTVKNIRLGTSILPVDLTVYDMDGMAGIRANGADTQDALRSGSDNAVQSMELMTMDQSLATQAAGAGVEAAKVGVSEICYTLFRGKLTTLFAGKEMQPML